MRIVRKVLILTVVIYFLLVMIAVIFQEKFLFRNTKLAVDYQYEFKEDFEEMWFEPKANARLNALYFKTDSQWRL